MNVAEAAARAGICTAGVYQAIRRGRLLATPVPIKLGYQYDITEEAFVQWRAARALTAGRRRQIANLILGTPGRNHVTD